MDQNKKLKTVLNIISNVVLYCFIFVCLVGVILTITAKKDADGTATVLGTQIRTVISPSMEKCELTDVSGYKIKDIPVNSLVFIQVVPTDADKAADWYDDLKVGDVLTFKYVYTRQETITHRITAIKEKPTGGYIIELEGDNKNSDNKTLTQVIDTSIADSPNYVIGKVTGQSYLIGLFITALKSPLGLIFIVIVPSLIIMTLEIIKIIRMYNDEKKKKDQEEKDQQQSELDELRRRLAELEAAKSETPSDEDSEKTEPVTDGEAEGNEAT